MGMPSWLENIVFYEIYPIRVLLLRFMMQVMTCQITRK